MPPGSTAHVPGGEPLGNPSVDELRLLGKCPTVEIIIGGVTVACLLDTGSMVTTVTQQFYEQYLQPQFQFQLQPCQWLKLKAANGLDIPCLGYLETTIGILGKTLPKMGVLLVKNPSDPAIQSRR